MQRGGVFDTAERSYKAAKALRIAVVAGYSGHESSKC